MKQRINVKHRFIYSHYLNMLYAESALYKINVGQKMSNNALHSSEILKKALFSLPQGMAVSSSDLKGFGVSRQLAHRYVQKGWLTLLGRGYYLRVGDKLTKTGAVASLQANGVKVHIGGNSALAFKGFAHYLSIGGETLTLYGHGTRKLPEWFQVQFRASLSNSVLFDEQDTLAERTCVSRLDNEPNVPFVSEPERAVLELLDFVPKQQTLEEAKQIMDGLYSLRSKKMQELLKACKKIKVKRLFWKVADELKLPVLKKIDIAAGKAFEGENSNDSFRLATRKLNFCFASVYV